VNSNIAKLINAARWLVVPVLFACAFGVQVQAQNENSPAPVPSPQVEQPRPAEGDAPLLPRLNLSDEQRTQLLAIKQQLDQDLIPAQARLHAARRALNQAINAPNPDQNLVNERVRDAAAAQAAIFQLRAQAEFKVRQVLTPEQLQKLRILRREQREALQRQRQLDGNNPNGGGRNPSPGANQTPKTQNNNGNPTPAEIRRERRQQRRQLNGAGRAPKP
jgi:Spy/CpxP family protein refolding chaperone